MRILLLVGVAAILAACSKTDNPDVAKADADLKAAAAKSGDAAKNLAAASAVAARQAAAQAKVVAAGAAAQTGAALQQAGAKISRTGDQDQNTSGQ
jgi:hypothetical protein